MPDGKRAERKETKLSKAINEQLFTLTEITEAVFKFNRVGYWNAVCDCRLHKGKPWIRISRDSLAKLAYLMQESPFTEEGAKALNHEIYNRVKKAN